MVRLFCAIWLANRLAAQVVITPSTPPVVNQGETFQFKANVPVTWSLAPGSEGFIDADGVYYAPAKVTPKQKAGGCQVLPNNHIFNTRIDSLPVHPRSKEWIANGIDSLGGRSLKYSPVFGLNLLTNEAPTEPMTFAYTPVNNGEFPFLKWPELVVESGYFSSPLAEVDRHIVSINRETCNFYEIYNKYPAGTQRTCSSCTAQSGVKYQGMAYALPTTGATDAGGLPLTPLLARLEEIRSGAIRHALRFTRVHPDQAHLWPATTSAYYGFVDGRMQMGARLRLRGDYDISGFSPTAQVLLTQLKEYGIILADAGLNWDIQADADVFADPAVRAAFNEIRSKVTATELEVVDESSLMVSRASGETGVGATVVIASSQTEPSRKALVQVALRGVTVGVPRGMEWVQSGATKQLQAWVQGASDKAVSWSMSPELGALTPEGLYTPPEVEAPTKTMLTAASAADPSATATVEVTVMPAGPIRIDVGNEKDFGPDGDGNVWWRDQGSEGMSIAYDTGYGRQWSDLPEIGVFHTHKYTFGDMVYRFTVPNGNYRITALFAESDPLAPGTAREFHIESQGQIARNSFNIASQTDNKGGVAVKTDVPTTVTDGNLYFALRRLSYPGRTVYHPLLNGLLIAADDSPPRITIDPPGGGMVTAGKTVQFYAVGWYMPNKVTWNVTSGPGTISGTGLYTAPANPVTVDTPVMITATSTEDGTMTATAELTLTFGTMTVSPATATVVRGGKQQFSATINGFNYKSVKWTVSPAIGTVDASGMYSAPEALAQDTTVTLTATSVDLPTQTASATLQLLALQPAIRVNCGWPYYDFTDAQGRTWKKDYGFSTPSQNYNNAVPIANTTPDMLLLYQSSRYRYSDENFYYSFDVANGTYQVTLKFADYTYTEPGHYNFDVKINGKEVLKNFDPDAAAGGARTAVDRTFETTVTNKTLRIDIIGHKGGGIINGIEILSKTSAGGTMQTRRSGDIRQGKRVSLR
jgi:hypothetical protein